MCHFNAVRLACNNVCIEVKPRASDSEGWKRLDVCQGDLLDWLVINSGSSFQQEACSEKASPFVCVPCC